MRSLGQGLCPILDVFRLRWLRKVSIDVFTWSKIHFTLSFILLCFHGITLSPTYFLQFPRMRSKNHSKNNNSKAVSYDDISRIMIVTTLDQLLPAIIHIYLLPLLWILSSHLGQLYVQPLLKTSNSSLLTHICPISILPFLFKVPQACVHEQISSLSLKTRSGHSTVTAMLKMTNDIRNGVEDAKGTVLVLILFFSNTFSIVTRHHFIYLYALYGLHWSIGMILILSSGASAILLPYCTNSRLTGKNAMWH